MKSREGSLFFRKSGTHRTKREEEEKQVSGSRAPLNVGTGIAAAGLIAGVVFLVFGSEIPLVVAFTESRKVVLGLFLIMT